MLFIPPPTLVVQKYTVEVHHHPKEVVVCSVLPEGVVTGGGDNCDFHTVPDPVFCRVFPREKGCGKHPEKLPNVCGTSFGCQNLDAEVPKGT